MLRWKSSLKPAVSGGGGGTSPGTTNLLAWYEMNDASGGAVDSHSGSYDLTENGTPLYAQTGVNGNAIDFDGSTDYFSLASTFGWSEAYPFSFSAFFKTSSASNQTISQITAPGAQGKYVLMNVQADGEVSAYVRAGTIQSITSSGAGVGDGAWHHLVATFVSATERYLYLDGVQVAGSASETSQAIDTAMSEIRVGADQSNGVSSYFDGLLEDVAFWSDELTLNEITWLYNSGSGRSYSAVSGGGSPGTANLVAWYDFDDSAGNGAVDSHSTYDLTENSSPTYQSASSPEYGIAASPSSNWTGSVDNVWGNAAGDYWYVIRFRALSGISNNDEIFSLNNDRNKLRWSPTGGVLRIRAGDLQNNVSDSTTEDVWYHVVASIDDSSGDMNCWVNNVAASTISGTPTYGSAGSLTIGGGSPTNGVDVEIDYMGFFTGIPTADNVDFLYNSGGTLNYSDL